MCSICGGTVWDTFSKTVWERSKDRGRDDSNKIQVPSGAWIGNHRATPTTEVLLPKEKQPVGKNPLIVFNGIISNDKELGIREGEADTSILPRVLDFSSLTAFRDSIEDKLVGSYAIAAMFQNGTIWLAANYKPMWILQKNGQFYFSSLKHHLGEQAIRFPPYSVGQLGTSSFLDISRYQSNKALVICSSGLDSTAVAAYAAAHHKEICLLHFDYGCLAGGRERQCLEKIARYLDCDFKILSLPDIFGNSGLLQSDSSKISSGLAGAEYAHEWVPARNLVMLSSTVAFAEAHDYGYIYLGTNLEEAGAYPDNEEQFIIDFNNLLYGAVQNGIKIEIKTPLGGLMKHEIVPFGMKFNAPFHLTWSCYKDGRNHCGNCGPCFMRRTAFQRNNMVDPVKYEEREE